MKKQQEALFKSLSNNQPTDRTTVFTQNAVWNALETYSYAPDEDKTSEDMRIRPTEDMKISILPTLPIGLMRKKKKSGYFYER